MTVWKTLGLGIAVAALCIGESAAATPDGPFYVSQITIDTRLEAKGFSYNHRYVNVYSALCAGRPRYGFRISETGSGMYWRFTCDLIDTNEHYYTVQISTTLGPNTNYWYLHILSARLEY